LRLIYTPVSTDNRNLVNQYHPHCLFNPIRQTPHMKSSPENAEYFADSGGYQIYQCKDDPKKRCLVLPGFGIGTHGNLLIIDPLDLCARFRAIGIKYGFTTDHPLSDSPSEGEFDQNLERSFLWAALMFENRSKLCPQTELFIPLHFSTPHELLTYYERMSQLHPKGYAFPVRGNFNLIWILKIAWTLCFLASRGVTKIHLLGSSRREIIILGAAALGLGMFDQISFDSTTWNTLLFDKRPIYFDPTTMKAARVVGQFEVELLLPIQVMKTHPFGGAETSQSGGEKLLMLHNAFAISSYADNMAKRARSPNAFKTYIRNEPHLRRLKTNLLLAINALEESTRKGFDFIVSALEWIWR
jgi:hypothetical protein